MNIKSICIQCDGYAYCKSVFYTAQNIMPNAEKYQFSSGINKLQGEIDCGAWAISYLLSMYEHCPDDFVLLNDPKISVNGNRISLETFLKYSCYMDKADKQNIYEMFPEGEIINKSSLTT